jgi:hypothetical protein
MFNMPNLTVKDKINYPFILANCMLNVHNALIKEEGLQSEQACRESVLVFFNSIPKSWIEDDPKFKEDMQETIIYEKVDNRSEWCGRKVGSPFCPHLKDDVECQRCELFKDCHVKEEKLQPYKLYHACVNVLDRKGLISKTEKVEMFDGKRFKEREMQEQVEVEENDGAYADQPE